MSTIAPYPQNLDSQAIERVAAIWDNYTAQTRRWLQWMIETDYSIDEEGIRAYFHWLNEESEYAASTICTKRQAVKKRVRWLLWDASLEVKSKVERWLTDLDHEHDTKAPSINTPEVSEDKVLTPRENADLLERTKSQRQRCFLEFLWQTGCRVSELTGVTLGRCTVQDRIVKIRVKGKGTKERWVRVTRTLFDKIIETFQGSEWLGWEFGSGQPSHSPSS